MRGRREAGESGVFVMIIYGNSGVLVYLLDFLYGVLVTDVVT